MAQSLSRQALRIFQAALDAADPAEAVKRHVVVREGVLRAGGHNYRLGSFHRIFMIGAGKASAAMARPIERMLGRRIDAGWINIKRGESARLRRIELNESGHPIPDQQGEAGARRIAEIARGAGAGDLVICLISGGASALLPLPAAPITLAEKQNLTELLLRCGADIQELNCVRKHISDIKGGQLARLAAPATVLTLVLSDVIGDDPGTIGSGPTAPDSTTYADARAILDKYGIANRVAPSIRKRLQGQAPDTPKPGDPVFDRVRNVVVGGNRLAVNAAVKQARALGFRTMVLSTCIEGETRDVGRIHAAIAREIVATGRPIRRPACVISGGETTVTIRGKGLGGRNQEFALAAAIDIAGLKDIIVLSAGTDGTDGPTDAAGAITDGTTVARASQLGLNPAAYLANNDSYRFFGALGDLIKTGPTGTNVSDIHIVLAG